MTDRTLAKQFNVDPGSAFLEVIQSAGEPVDARRVKRDLTSAGAPKAAVDAAWRRLQRHLAAHPHVNRPTMLRYEWNTTTPNSLTCLEDLSSRVTRTTPQWLTKAFTDVVSDALAAAETSGSRAQTSWSRQREWEKAELLAEIIAEASRMLAGGSQNKEVAEWLSEVAAEHRLERFTDVGDVVRLDPTAHEPIFGEQVRVGEEAIVQRAGYRWRGGGEPVIIVKATVTAQR